MLYEHRTKVYINHTDAGGIVYHANHLTFYENCRREWLSHAGFHSYFLRQSPDDDSVVHFVVSRADVRYLTPMLLDDILSVGIEKVTQKPASLILEQAIYRQHGDKKILCSSATITLACVKNSGDDIRPARLPADFVRAISTS